MTKENLDLDAIETKILEGDYPEWDIVLSIIDELRGFKKGKKMGTPHLPKSLGTYKFDKSTARFHAYTRENEKGVKETFYIFKDHLDGNKPDEIEVFVRY